MKINISYPATGGQKMIEIEDEKKLRCLFDQRVGAEIDGEGLGSEFKGYVFRISGGNDKQGFAMMQGVLVPTRVRLLLDLKHKCYRPRAKGERRRKSVRGCIVSSEIQVLNLVVSKAGETPLAGVTDVNIPKRLGPKRASKIRKLFDLDPKEALGPYVVRRKYVNKAGKEKNKAPKIQRLVTPVTLQRKRQMKAEERSRHERVQNEVAAYEKLRKQRAAESKERRASEAEKRRSRASQEEAPAKPVAAVAKPVAAPAKAAAAKPVAAAPAKVAAAAPVAAAKGKKAGKQ